MVAASRSFFARGKLLLTSEYVVLDGTPAVAVPTHKGQRMDVLEAKDSGLLAWTARAHDGSIWLQGSLERTPEGWRPSAAQESPASGLDAVSAVLTAAEHLRGTPLPGGSVETFFGVPQRLRLGVQLYVDFLGGPVGRSGCLGASFCHAERQRVRRRLCFGLRSHPIHKNRARERPMGSGVVGALAPQHVVFGSSGRETTQRTGRGSVPQSFAGPPFAGRRGRGG